MNGDIFLQELTPEKVTQDYVAWMNDPEINQYLESRFQVHTLASVKAYVQTLFESKNALLFGIYLQDSQKHIGNIKVGKINTIHKSAEVGIIIGDKEEWGKGYATKSIVKIIDYAKNTLQLNTLYSGMYHYNQASYRAFIKAGFTLCGTLHHHYAYKNGFCHKLILEYQYASNFGSSRT